MQITFINNNNKIQDVVHVKQSNEAVVHWKLIITNHNVALNGWSDTTCVSVNVQTWTLWQLLCGAS